MYSVLAILLWLLRCVSHVGRGRAAQSGRELARDDAHAGHAARGPLWPRNAPKPAWVHDEIIRMKTLMPDAGCRTIEVIFNRRFALSHGVTIGKTCVANVLARHRYARQARYFKMQYRLPKVWPHNMRWGVDLTLRRGKTQRYWIFGVIEYRSRALLVLVALVRKSAAVLVTVLAEVFRRFGAPRELVTDNEGPFRSGAWRRLLGRHGVRHRRIEPHCPWQNGRIERFFGTLKSKLRQRSVQSLAGLQRDLDVFRYWYNRIRPHQALAATLFGVRTRAQWTLTPAEAWGASGGRDTEYLFEGWDGLLRGYVHRE